MDNEKKREPFEFKKPKRFKGKNYYFIKYKGKYVRRFGLFRNKFFTMKTIRNKIPKWEQKDYEVGHK